MYMENDKIHPMRVVARRTGLSAHVIRIWERRYLAVEPVRTQTNRRLYSDADVERLKLLHQATGYGHSISQIARFSTDQLESLIADDAYSVTRPVPTQNSEADPQNPESYVDEVLAAVRNMDPTTLEAILFRAEVGVGRNKLFSQVIEPLMQQIGELWSNGDLRIANEHMATSVIRSFIGRLENTTLSSPKGPAIVIATPAGEWHEIGALLVSLTAARAGWSVVYLGANLPAEEIAAVALEHRARAVALSLIYCDKDDHHLGAELRKLRRALGTETTILVGGRGAQQNLDILDGIEAEILTGLDGLGTRLESLNRLPVS